MNEARQAHPWLVAGAPAAAPSVERQGAGRAACVRHGALDPSWLLCPACVKERRALEGGAAPASLAPPTVREPRRPALALLMVQEGDQAGRSFRLGLGATRIGRDPRNEIVLADPAVSRFHAVINRTGEELLLSDERSTNGTYVNGERVTLPRRLANRDLIRAGSVVLLLKLMQEPSEP